MNDWKSDDWDPEEERRAIRKRMQDMGLEPFGFYGLIRREKVLFEMRLDAFARSKYQQGGIRMPDWWKNKHRSQFDAFLVKIYGTCHMDPDIESHPDFKPIDEDDIKRMRERAEREFTRRYRREEPDQATAASMRAIGLMR